MNPFRMYGQTIQVYHWKAEYTENDEQIVQYFPSKKEADATGGIVTQINSSEYDWLDGIKVPQSTDPFAEAMKIYKEGEKIYQEKKNLGTNLNNSSQIKINNSVGGNTNINLDQLKADLDYLAALQGVVL